MQIIHFFNGVYISYWMLQFDVTKIASPEKQDHLIPILFVKQGFLICCCTSSVAF